MTMVPNDTFDLAIIDSGNSTSAVAIVRSEHDLSIERVSTALLPDLKAFGGRLAAAAEGRAASRPDEKTLTKFGHNLFEFSMPSRVKTVYDRLPTTHIRVHIYSDWADLQALPWEFMQDPRIPPGPNTLRSVVRVVPTVGINAPTTVRMPKKLRMLFVYSDPVDQESIDWADIKDSIKHDFEAFGATTALEMDPVESATADDMRQKLSAKPYDVLHFVGHGNENGELMLVDRTTQQSDPVSAVTLGGWMRGTTLRLVVLSSCKTSAGDFTQQYRVLAKTLVESGVPAVVANQYPISNTVAAKFAGDFYAELLRNGGDVDLAASKGRLALAPKAPVADKPAQFDWGIPTLYRHMRAARLWGPR